MRKLLLVLGFLIFSLPMLGQSAFYQLPNPVSNTNVLFCPVPSGGNPCPSPSSVFSDQALTQAVSNPFPIGSGGSGGWWLSPGQYTVILGAPYNQQFIINLAGSGGGLGASVTFNNSGTGGSSPQVYNGSAARTISRNTLGAAASNASTTVNGQICALGSTCTVPAVTGSGAAKQVGVWDSPLDLTGDANFTWDGTIQQLNVQGLTNTGQATLTVENTGNASQPSQGVIVTTTLSDSTGTPNAHFGTGIQVLAAANGTSNFTGTGLNSPAVGIFTQSTSASSGTTQEIDGLQIGSNIKSAGTLVNNYGLRVFPQQTVGTNNFGIEIDDQGTGAANYALKILGGRNNLGPQPTNVGALGLATTGGITFDKVNDGTTGTTTNLLVCKGSVAGTVVTCPSNTKTGVLGSAVSGIGTAPGTTGSTSVCFSGICSAIADGTTVIGHYGIPSATAGRIHDTGATTPTANTDSFLITSVATVGNPATYEISTPDWFAQQAVAKVYQLQVAGGTAFTAGDTVNFNASTPAVPTGDLGVTFQTSKSGSTDSVSAYIAGPLLATGTSVSLTAPTEIYVCTGTCTVTPPVPAAGYEFCVMNDDNVSTVITLAALGSSARYENTGRTAYGTAGTGTFVSGGAVKDMVCLVGRDSTHYLTTNFNGTWTAN